MSELGEEQPTNIKVHGILSSQAASVFAQVVNRLVLGLFNPLAGQVVFIIASEINNAISLDFNNARGD